MHRSRERGKRELTIGLGAKTLGDLASLLEVDVPALGLTSSVLQGEGEDGVTLLDGILAVGIGGVQGLVDGIKGSGGRELVYTQNTQGQQMSSYKV